MLGKLKRVLDKIKINRKRKQWACSGKINIDPTVLIFKETSISAFSGQITVEAKSCIRGTLEIQRQNGEIHIGSNCYVGDHTRIWAANNIKIGNNVLIAHNVNIFDNDTHPIDYLERNKDAENIIFKGGLRKNFTSLHSAPVEICDNAWIGCNSIILKGVKIGEGAIIGAGSVVTKDVPPNTLVGGNPASVLKVLQEERV